MKLDQFNNKDIVFVGVGKGRSFEGFKDFITTHGVHPASVNGVEKQSGETPLNFLKKYDVSKTIFVKNEGVPGREMPVSYISPTQLFFDCIKDRGATIIGITGTKGKTTTTSLIGAMLRAADKKTIVAGNIGTSLLHYVDQIDQGTYLVTELSSHQLAELRVSPHIAVVTNLYEDHLDYYGSLEVYWEAKHNLVRYMDPDDYYIYNPDFRLLQKWAEESKAQSRPINTDETIDMNRTGLIGEHNRLNALMAREAARLCGVSDEVIQTALDTFEPVEHRLQTVKTVDSITFVDDAIASQPEAAAAGILAVTGSIGPVGCVLLGGQDRDYDFTELFQTIANHKIPALVFFPDTVAKMKAALPSGYHPKIYETSNMRDAVRWASEHAPKDSVVLLSNGAPSYSLWKDFEEKGDLFQKAVLAL